MKLYGTGALLADINLDRDSHIPLSRQLYLQIRQQILSGLLQPGTRLPATRILVAELRVSRITVVNAFEQLIAEGFLTAKIGSGTYVSAQLQPQKPPHLPRQPQLSQRGQATISARGRLFDNYPAVWSPERGTAFIPSHIAFDAFPTTIWKRILGHQSERSSKEYLAYGEKIGHPSLRQAIVTYLRDIRGIQCHEEQVVITSGAQQAFNLLSMLLLNPGEWIYMEDPGHIAARLAFLAQSCQLQPLPVDEKGITLPGDDMPVARMVFTTPSRQHPLGHTMSLNRRMEWINWASSNNGWIIEDDCDSELRYEGNTPPTLYYLDQYQRVIYVGTFSKVLFPSLRLGYVVLPEDLVDSFSALRAAMNRSPPTMLQAATAEFMQQGYLISHIRRMRLLYQKRQNMLVQELNQQLAGVLQVQPAAAGLHLLAWLGPESDDAQIAERLAQEG
ncbi:MAG: PLP-dependent aminotransferase family protein, partial [Enterobacteriaceae bacterium]